MPGNVPLGVFLGVAAKAISSLGLVLQKLAHIRNAAKDEAARVGYCADPLWLIGFGIYFGGNAVAIAALTLAPQTIIAALDALVPVFNALYAPRFLGEETSLMDWAAAAVIIAGISAVVVCGPHAPEESRTDEELMHMLYAMPYIAYAAVATALIAIVILVQEYGARLQCLGGLEDPSTCLGRFAAVSAGVIPAMLSGFTQQFSKVFGGIVGSTFSGGDDLTRWQAYFWIFSLLAICAIEINRLQKALKRFPALVVVPVFQVSVVMFSVISGGLYFNEFDSYADSSPIRPAIFTSGLLVAVSGVFLASTATRSSTTVEDGSQGGIELAEERWPPRQVRWTLPAPARSSRGAESERLCSIPPRTGAGAGTDQAPRGYTPIPSADIPSPPVPSVWTEGGETGDVRGPAAARMQRSGSSAGLRHTFSAGDAAPHRSRRRPAASNRLQSLARGSALLLLPIGGGSSAALALLPPHQASIVSSTGTSDTGGTEYDDAGSVL